ncbi:hypothetical protein H310_14651 [Aphanomyces invadans]|uniref:Uncharacterized protein n=1 Tax=Aphanomyces invadans TaxID=157072 RepID=A0A024TAG7_9STRA|nr:hypothetical protein H310_14651 [Aphanomyces invadans]ETV90616.1 hypothetical protein H310_14651 [Aphanomyces invadans]|eukprot:XP_008880769.1 hypothetical protein H310_14651 [Aphanomyces invadans]
MEATNVLVCQFNRCMEPALHDDKCQFHRMRSMCMIDMCTNQVYARKRCVKHGGKRQCQAHGCQGNARSHGFCCKHGPKPLKRQCLVEGCVKFAHARRFCVQHGRRARQCSVELCSAHDRNDGSNPHNTLHTRNMKNKMGGSKWSHGNIGGQPAAQQSFDSILSFVDEWALLGEYSMHDEAFDRGGWTPPQPTTQGC